MKQNRIAFYVELIIHILGMILFAVGFIMFLISNENATNYMVLGIGISYFCPKLTK